MFQKIAILGPGLLGGSIALAARERGAAREIAVWVRTASALPQVLASGCAHIASTDLEMVIAHADLVVFATPIGAMASLARAAVAFIEPGAIVTDVGSVKAEVVRALTGIFAGRAHFIGGHPIAGSEKSGLSAARSNLFENALCILTPGADTDRAALDRLTQFWMMLGSRVKNLPPSEHDEVLATVSHLPHLVASALVHYAGATGPDTLGFSGSGFRDTTRVAAGPAEMWAGILQGNRTHVRSALRDLQKELARAEKLLDENNGEKLREYLQGAKDLRDRI